MFYNNFLVQRCSVRLSSRCSHKTLNILSIKKKPITQVVRSVRESNYLKKTIAVFVKNRWMH